MSSNKKNWNAKTIFHRFTILAVSLVITSGTAISPALPAMEKAFSSYPASLVDMVATIQQIPAFIILLFSSMLAKRFGIKRVMGMGIFLMGISGVLPTVVPNLWFILFSRIIFGIGIGLLNSLAITIINLFYESTDRSQMLGNRSSFEQLGLCLTNLMVGFLLNISWQVSFLAYSFIILVFLLFWFVVPPVNDETDDDSTEVKTPARVNLPVILGGVVCGLMTIGMGAVSIMMPGIVVANKLGSATDASYIITIFTLTSMGLGFLFGTFFKIFKKFVFPLGLFALAVGMMLVNMSDSFITLTVSVMVVGIAFPLAGNYVFNLMEVVAPKNSNALANSVLLIGCNLGTAVAPIVIRSLTSISPLKGLQPGVGLFGVIILVVMFILLVAQVVNHQKTLVSGKRNKHLVD